MVFFSRRRGPRRSLSERAAFGAFWCALWIAGWLVYTATGSWYVTFVLWAVAVILAAK